MRVMTWNLLTHRATDAPSWSVRVPVVAATVGAVQPTVLGTQEGSAEMLADLVALLPEGYRWVGEGRLGRGRDETCSVVYDAHALTVLDVRHRWLSPTPTVPGSMASDADLPRMVTGVRFHDGGSGEEFTVVNTHLDHLGEQARRDGAAAVASEARVGPCVVTGDFNAPAGASAAYDTLVGSGLVDALAGRERAPTFPTSGEAIDWILVTGDVTVSDAWVGTVPEGYASDHRPVVADLRWPGPSR